MLYCTVTFDRSGLGNRLFPWARCRVFSEKHGAPMLAPRWAWPLRIGPLLRGVHNLESLIKALAPREWYVGLFRPGAKELTGSARAGVLRRARVLPEPADLAVAPTSSDDDALVEFRGIGSYFEPLNGWEDFLHRELRSVARPDRVRFADGVRGEPIGIHVRLGDFVRAKTPEELKRGNTSTPLDWYVRSLGLVREALGSAVPAYVFSDGTADQLRPLLALERVRLVRGDDPISGILALAQARILLGAGGSSFSSWAAFLGQMPAISMPGHPLNWHRFSSRGWVGEFDPSAPPRDFLEQIARMRL